MAPSKLDRIKRLVEESACVSSLTEKIADLAFSESLVDKQKHQKIDSLLREASYAIDTMKRKAFEAFRED